MSAYKLGYLSTAGSEDFIEVETRGAAQEDQSAAHPDIDSAERGIIPFDILPSTAPKA